jgi:hypothetical protein
MTFHFCHPPSGRLALSGQYVGCTVVGFATSAAVATIGPASRKANGLVVSRPHGQVEVGRKAQASPNIGKSFSGVTLLLSRGEASPKPGVPPEGMVRNWQSESVVFP